MGTSLRWAVAAAALSAFVTCTAAATTVTGASLYKRCKADNAICDAAMTWIWTNTGACTDTRMSHANQVAQVIAWLKKRPAATAAGDNDLAGQAIEALWPCHL